ncbi:MAG: tRNA (guanosine(37)-N1)-methyltransferase TrmD [Candidatus Omnitrophica bacterium]|nr:tRNA (guanosine(37)-N1)-methyltransferase TrmD [Candidatus Omnitrophota bacterium]
MMKIDVLTLFPGMFKAVLGESILKRAIHSGKISVEIHNIRDYTKDKHKKADNRPFGGGCGMVLGIQPVFDAVCDVKKNNKRARVILMSPQGEVFTHDKACGFSREKGLIIISGHYEGIDERVKSLIDSEISIGDYVLTGGEIPAMAVIDAVTRLIPGVLGHSESNKDESFSNPGGLLEYPQYTRPAVFEKMKVPQVLLSGNHAAIKAWRRKESVQKTMDKRPDIIRDIKQIEI